MPIQISAAASKTGAVRATRQSEPTADPIAMPLTNDTAIVVNAKVVDDHQLQRRVQATQSECHDPESATTLHANPRRGSTAAAWRPVVWDGLRRLRFAIHAAGPQGSELVLCSAKARRGRGDVQANPKPNGSVNPIAESPKAARIAPPQPSAIRRYNSRRPPRFPAVGCYSIRGLRTSRNTGKVAPSQPPVSLIKRS